MDGNPQLSPPGTDLTALFHPAVAAWFARSFPAPTAAQAQAWPAIRAGRNTLIAAPTGSGKTLAAFLAAIDALLRQGLRGELADATQVVYVSPLKALSNDIQRNLQGPLAGIREELRASGLPDVEIRTWVRTGDTPAAERERARRAPPHIVVTTPESLYILLGSQSGRAMLATTRTVIVDEIHAVAGNKRGAHLAVSLERLQSLCGDRLLRIGLSATQKPIETVARFLVGLGGGGQAPERSPSPQASPPTRGRGRQGRPEQSAALLPFPSPPRRGRGLGEEERSAKPAERAVPPTCTIVDTGHHRARDLALELPDSPLESVMSAEVWTQIYDRLAALIAAHRTTLIFVNTRRMAERVTRQLSERVGEADVAAHHGSLAKEQRLDAEQRLKHGALKALVATASLELGIDIGDVDLVCQLGSPHAIASFLQRVGRSGHAVGGTPKGRLFPLSRDELVECTALLDSVRRGELDRLAIPDAPLDVLAQQIVAEVAAQDWNEDQLFALIRRAWSFRTLPREDFSAVLRMLAEGFGTSRGRRGALIHHDAVNRMLRGRRGARLTAITSGGTIPDTADYQVLLEPENHVIGSVNEDFAVESLTGDIFQLGNKSYRIIRVERGIVRVEDAHGQPPSIPFWLGEAPGRSDELSQSVSRLRGEMAARLAADPSGDGAFAWLTSTVGLAEPPARQLVDYLAAAHAALGVLPTLETIVFERFFDEAGGMQLVIHSPYGSRINRAWGLALRKRFCRKFNFELQAAATEDNIVLSLTTVHSFVLEEVARYLHSASVREVLVQALLDAPMFATRWRWVAGVALALPRFRGGKKVPPQLARMQAEDLVASVFPDQLACAENLPGDREIPDHPLVRQAIADCLHEAMDIAGLERLLGGSESGAIQVVARDLTEPSPLALEVLSARPYAYLDDAPLEERRTQAVMSRRWLAPEAAADIGRLDPEAIARVREEAWPDAASADELADALSWVGFLTDTEATGPHWGDWLAALAGQRRVARLCAGPHPTLSRKRERAKERLPLPLAGEGRGEGLPPPQSLWIAAERVPQFQALWPHAQPEPVITAPPEYAREWSPEDALVDILRGRMQGLGPVTEPALAAPLGLDSGDVAAALAALEGGGFALRGRFTPGAAADEWCERRLLARIHRYTVKRLRAEIEPVAARDFLRFLFAWQRVAGDTRMEGPDSLPVVIAQLEGFEAAAAAWESEILAQRIGDYEPAWLDDECLAGRVAWARLSPRNGRASGSERGPTGSPQTSLRGAPTPVRSTPITLLARRHAPLWTALSAPAEATPSPRAQAVIDSIRDHGASFFDELVDTTGLLRTQVEEALAELVALGLVTSDSFGGLRALLVPSEQRKPFAGGRRRRRIVAHGMEGAGRWALARRTRPAPSGPASAEAVEHVASTLLRRYGVVFWRLLEREAGWLPPWRDLLRVYRRMEVRGDIRGGRFVAGFSGEQFALPEAIGKLREIRRRPDSGAWLCVCGADPLNLVGILTPGGRLHALASNRVLYRDGIPVAIFAAGDVRFLEKLEPGEQWQARKTLLRGAMPLPRTEAEPAAADLNTRPVEKVV